MEGGQENSLIQNFFSQYNLFTLGKMRRCEKSYLFMELKNQNKTGDEDASTTFSYGRFMSFCSPLWADWWHCFAPFSLVFNSILPAKAACSSQINPHPSCTFYLLHPPPHPSHLPSCRSQVLQDTDVQFGMFSARSKIHPYQWSFSSDSTLSAHLPPVLDHRHLCSPWVMVMFQLFLN